MYTMETRTDLIGYPYTPHTAEAYIYIYIWREREREIERDRERERHGACAKNLHD